MVEERKGADAAAAISRLPGEDAILAVRVGEAEYGLPVRRVQEVLQVPRLTRVPGTPPTLRGVTSVRGEVVPVVDLVLRLAGREAREEGRLVVLAHGEEGEPVAVLVDAVQGLVGGSAEVEEAPPEVVASLPPGFIRGVLSPEEDRLVSILDVERVLELTDLDEGEGP